MKFSYIFTGQVHLSFNFSVKELLFWNFCSVDELLSVKPTFDFSVSYFSSQTCGWSIYSLAFGLNIFIYLVQDSPVPKEFSTYLPGHWTYEFIPTQYAMTITTFKKINIDGNTGTIQDIL